ncbi:MAG: acyltransferase family protein [Shimia sp.]|uniref:acyltransferase family protein n=1 Tax=Shimia sp. TaxID=1954381 RepID=UPI0040588A7F
MPAHTPSPALKAEMRTEIDTIRAVVCVVLVLHHMVGISPAYGLELPLDHPISLLSHTTEDMRMPIFSFISGMVFVRVTGLWPDAQITLRKKARRLLLPMATVGTLFWLARTMVGIDQPPLASIYVSSYAHFWFLQASFLIMTAALLLACLFGGNHHKHIAFTLGALGIVWWGFGALPLPATNWFSITNAAFLLPFFMSGYLLAQSPKLRKSLRTRPLSREAGAVLLLSGLLIGWQLATGALEYAPAPRRVVAILLGFFACFGLILLRPSSQALAKIGAASYAIYLFHVFFTAATTTLWQPLSDHISLGVVLIFGITLGTFGPILVQRLLLKSPILALFCLGLPLTRTRKPNADQHMYQARP